MVLRMAQTASGLVMRLVRRSAHRIWRGGSANAQLEASMILRSGVVIRQDLLA